MLNTNTNPQPTRGRRHTHTSHTMSIQTMSVCNRFITDKEPQFSQSCEVTAAVYHAKTTYVLQESSLGSLQFSGAFRGHGTAKLSSFADKECRQAACSGVWIWPGHGTFPEEVCSCHTDSRHYTTIVVGYLTGYTGYTAAEQSCL